MTRKRFDPFLLLALLPAASFVALRAYVSGFDGRGAWGAAPLLLVPVFLSLPITLAAVLRWRRARAEGEPGTAAILKAVVAGVPLMWLIWRLIVS